MIEIKTSRNTVKSKEKKKEEKHKEMKLEKDRRKIAGMLGLRITLLGKAYKGLSCWPCYRDFHIQRDGQANKIISCLSSWHEQGERRKTKRLF